MFTSCIYIKCLDGESAPGYLKSEGFACIMSIELIREKVDFIS